jgi:hypothetical protein
MRRNARNPAHGAAYQPLRSAIVFAHTRAFFDETGYCASQFGMEVAELYVARVAPDLREQGPNFKLGVTTDELCAAQRHNGQLIRRYMGGIELKVFPADLEDAWVLALPEPYRGDCERALARGRGMLPFWLAMGEGAASLSVGAMAVEFGELVQALAPTLADGQFTREDLPHARRILDEADGLIASVLSVRAQIEDLLAQGSGRAGDKKPERA